MSHAVFWRVKRGRLRARLVTRPILNARDRGAVMRMPKMFNLRTGPFERADITSNTYGDWMIDHVYLLVSAQGFIGDEALIAEANRALWFYVATHQACAPPTKGEVAKSRQERD